jgi:hypothetical protein
MQCHARSSPLKPSYIASPVIAPAPERLKVNRRPIDNKPIASPANMWSATEPQKRHFYFTFQSFRRGNIDSKGF